MIGKAWPKEHYDYLKKIALGRYTDEITIMINDKFGTNYTQEQIKNAKIRKKIKSEVSRCNPNIEKGLFTKEQQDFIRTNAKGRMNQELADMVNEKFSLSITAKQINIWKKNNGVISGIDCRFKKGNIPWCTGMKGLDIGGKETRFKKGHKPWNHTKVGTLRLNPQGYIDIKIGNPKKWKSVHSLFWEELHGPIPDGHIVIFADNDKYNFEPDNLILVSRSELATLNKKKLIHKNAEITKTGVNLAKIYQKINELQRKLGEQ